MSPAVQEETHRSPGMNREGAVWPRINPHGVALAVLVWFVTFTAVAQGSESPIDAVRGTVDQVMHILEDPALKDSAKLMPRRRMLEEVVATRFDYAEMSKRALAAYWVPLTAAERAEFVEAFKKFLSDRYAEKIEGYSGQQVVYLSERIEGSYAEVRSELRSKKTTIPLDYRLLLKEGRWYAYDLIADGVSLVKNYRSQFNTIIRDSSYQELVKKLRERALSGETKTTP